MGGGVVWPLSNGFLKMGDRLCRVSLRHQGGSQAVMRLRIVGLEAKRLLQTGGGGCRLARVQQGVSKTAMGVGVVGPKLGGPLKARRCLVELLLKLQRDSQAEIRPGVVRLQAQRLPETVESFRSLSLDGQFNRKVNERIGESRLEPKCGLKALDRLIASSRATCDHPQEMRAPKWPASARRISTQSCSARGRLPAS